LSRGAAPDLPLDVMGADIQGGLGYMIERVLRDKLRARGLDLAVCCMLSMVEVRADDPALAEPTKFVGPVFEAAQLEACRARGWVMKEDRGRGWRRVVPSPEPIGIVERRELATLLDAGAVVISGGGGGIPVFRTADGTLAGFEGVIDKDHASAILALEIGAPELFILTGVDQVMVDFATPAARAVSRMTAAEARGHLAAGQFPAGSMGPKVEAACRFVERGGARCLITGIDSLVDALDGKTGTWIVP
jgi:carbamate kinase